MQMTRSQELEYMMQLSELQKMIINHLMKFNSITLDEYLEICRNSIDKTDSFKNFVKDIMNDLHKIGENNYG